MAVKKATEVLRVFIWRFTNKKDKAGFELFQKLAVVNGQRPDDLLMTFVRNYNRNNDVEFTPVSEQEMLEAINRNQKLTRQQLKRLRDTGELKREQHWFTDGKAIVYDREGVLAALKERRRAKA